MRAEVVCVGDELLSGRVPDANAAWLGARLAEHGVPVLRSTAVPDEVTAIVDAIGAAAARADLVVVTGGLGATSDDLTRDALAVLTGSRVVRDPALEEALRRRYADRGTEPPVGSLRMADVVEGAQVLPNPAGAAAGLRGRVGGAQVVLLPGVPAEVRAIAEQSVLPGLAGAAGLVTRTLHVPRVAESAVGTALARLEAALPAGVRVAYLASRAEVEVRLTAAAASPAAAEEVLAPVLASARSALATLSPIVDDVPLAVGVVRRLTARGETVAVAESLTGGLVTGALTSVPGSSAVLRGGVVAYATPVKADVLGVGAGLLAERTAVDPDVALAMAEGVRALLGADWGVSTTGVAGPGPSEGKPAGEVHVGVVGPGARGAQSLRFRAEREGVRASAVAAALASLRERLG
ncbi:CinA family nicotinamide mononucleotide deamidase-related protein [Motilibacter aurantiacus]|uniref:CinA family nicotinamide mononucleotide deamidase-related protein n=1 Tax=Motilibacter aurantiacus TaxID=2714955 RepID=UPI001407C40F|nr:CinA family nicotinamide mononucleotide deamidase-related protein [Motilibacter aurantiacus]